MIVNCFRTRTRRWLAGWAGVLLVTQIPAAPLAVNLDRPPPAQSGYFKLGTTTNSAGHEINVDSRSLRFDGQPVFPVMGEIHYSRVPRAEWRDELLKLKAGGVDIVATYVFWIHHEEIEGQWDWSGQRDLKQFVQTCGELGLKVIVRCGPWCHGEVRNGGFPDWVVAHKEWKLRSTDTNFLAAVNPLYRQIAQQLQGQLWKDGGPVIGLQVDNEFGGSPNYLMTLKKMAVAAGLDVPLYIKTGWPAMKSPVPLGELLPLFGAYPDGFWTRNLKPMDGKEWENYTFKLTRTDTGVGNDTLKVVKTGDTAGTEKYPYLTCEIGGGMPASYHRRMNYDDRDVEAVVLTQLGGGGSLLGYYMYHGGQNPEGKRSTLQESTATGYANDLPVKNYDFNAPLGEYGQINPQYHWLRRLHLFLHDFGAPLAQMPPTLPELLPAGKSDLTTLRWVVRSDGESGFLFVNNYQRLQPLSAKRDVQFRLQLPGGELLVPDRPLTIPANAFFFWPFNFDLGGVKLIYATAQPLCAIDDGTVRTVFFAGTPGVKSRFAFANPAPHQPTVVRELKPGRDVGYSVATPSGRSVHIVLLSEADSLALWKGEWAGAQRVVLAPAGVTFAGGKVQVVPEAATKVSVAIFPAPAGFALNGKSGQADGLFRRFTVPAPSAPPGRVGLELIHPAGPLRETPFDKKSHLALVPEDADFAAAAVWKIKLPENLSLAANPLLRLRYVGDVARLTLNGRLLDDQFYCGRPFDLGLRRYGPEILTGDLRLEILPLRRNAPVYLESSAQPDWGGAESLARVDRAEILNRPTVEFSADQGTH